MDKPSLYKDPTRNMDKAYIKTTETQRWEGTPLSKPVPRRFDAVAFGETMASQEPIGLYTSHSAPTMYMTTGGGETNQIVALSYIFGMRGTVIGAVVADNEGFRVRDSLRQAGVILHQNHFLIYNKDPLGKYYTPLNTSNAGKGIRVPETEYKRANSPMRLFCDATDFHITEFFENEGTHIAIVGGICNIISPKIHEANLLYLDLAGQTGAFRIGDLNFRKDLVADLAAKDKELPQRWSHEMVDRLDMVIGNQSDYQKQLGFKTTPIDPKAPLSEVLGAYQEMLKEVHKAKPNLKMSAVQLRNAITADRIQWLAAIYDPVIDDMYISPIFKGMHGEGVEIGNRIGGGDSVSSAIAGILFLGYTLKDAGVTWPDTPMVVDRDQQEFIQHARVLEDNVLISAATFGAVNGLLTQTLDGDVTRILWPQLRDAVKTACEGTGAHVAR